MISGKLNFLIFSTVMFLGSSSLNAQCLMDTLYPPGSIDPIDLITEVRWTLENEPFSNFAWSNCWAPMVCTAGSVCGDLSQMTVIPNDPQADENRRFYFEPTQASALLWHGAVIGYAVTGEVCWWLWDVYSDGEPQCHYGQGAFYLDADQNISEFASRDDRWTY